MNTLILSPSVSIRYRITLNFKLVWFLILISIISLLVFYIFQVNSLTYESYLLKNQEKRLAELKKEKDVLEINFSRTHSLVNIENYFHNHNFEKAEKIKYIQILETSIAAK